MLPTNNFQNKILPYNKWYDKFKTTKNYHSKILSRQSDANSSTSSRIMYSAMHGSYPWCRTIFGSFILLVHVFARRLDNNCCPGEISFKHELGIFFINSRDISHRCATCVQCHRCKNRRNFASQYHRCDRVDVCNVRGHCRTTFSAQCVQCESCRICGEW
jgi:hypothetical protein